MTVERDPRATTAQQCSKGLILLKKQTAYLSKTLILHAHEIGTFCIDCTGTPITVSVNWAASARHSAVIESIDFLKNACSRGRTL